MHVTGPRIMIVYIHRERMNSKWSKIRLRIMYKDDAYTFSMMK